MRRYVSICQSQIPGKFELCPYKLDFLSMLQLKIVLCSLIMLIVLKNYKYKETGTYGHKEELTALP